MKRILLLSCLALLAVAGRMQAQCVTVDGIEYTVDTDGQTATVTNAGYNITEAHVPAIVNINGMDYPVTAIGDYAFAWHSALESIALSEGMETIGGMAFYSCYSLASIDLPEGLQSIGESAFNACTALRSVTLPEGTQSIGNMVFAYCASLAGIVLPSTMQYIDATAFADCPLKEVYSHAAVPPTVSNGLFDEEIYAVATLHVPSNAVEAYQAAEGWKQFLNIVGDLPPVSIEDVATDASLAIYANGILTTESPAAITVYAQSGAQVRHAADATSLSLAGLPRGIYIICVAQGGQRQVMKVLH